jgi:hypothetical protein
VPSAYWPPGPTPCSRTEECSTTASKYDPVGLLVVAGPGHTTTRSVPLAAAAASIADCTVE